MNLGRSLPNSGFLFVRWLLAGVLGFGMGIPLSWLLTFGSHQVVAFNEDRAWPVFMFVCVGALIGLFQALLARPVLPAPGRWLAASVLGSLIAALPVVVFNIILPDISPTLAVNILQLVWIGGSLGLAQWLVLRARYPAAGWWIPANILGLASLSLAGSIGFFSIWDLALQSMLPGLLFSIPTGLLLAWLVRREKTVNKNPEGVIGLQGR